MPPRQTAKGKLREISESAPYLYYKDRLATFKGFSFDKEADATCTSEKLARAGFYCTGVESGKCPFCLKELEFESQDDPWEEHRTRGADCEFVKLGKLDDKTWTLADSLSLAIHSITMAKYEQQLSMLKDWQSSLTSDSVAEQITKMIETTAKKSNSRAAK